MKRKITIITISYIIGLIWGLYFNKNITLIFIGILAICILKLRKNKFLVIIICSLIISSIYNGLFKYNLQKKYSNLSEVSINGVICEKVEDMYYEKYIIKINDLNNDARYKSENVLMYIKKNNESLEIGDKIYIEGNFLKPEGSRNYGGYDYEEYLKSQKIYGSVEVKVHNIKIIEKNSMSIFKKIINETRKIIKEKFSKYLPKEHSDFCVALILGDKQEVHKKIIKNFSDSNLSHILAVSGMHLTYIISICLMLSKLVGKNKQNIVLILFIFFFCNLTGNTSSIVRASIMMSLYFLSKIFYRKSDSITNLSISVLLILINNPYSIKSLSFLLSVGGTLGIIVFYNPITKLFDSRLNLKNKSLKYLQSQLILGISANIIILPITAIIFNKISFVFCFSNPVASILLNIIMPLIFSFLFISIVNVTFASFLSKILNMFLNLLIEVSEFFSNFYILNISIITPKLFTIIFYYLLVILFFAKLNVNVYDKKIIKKIIKKIFIIYLAISLTFYVINVASTKMHIFFIDVGQGDSTLIITRCNKTVLIDGGGSDKENDFVGERVLFPYLLDRGVKTIDFAMISHFDSDHCKGILYIMENLEVKNIIISKQIENSNNYNMFLEIVKKKKINIIVVAEGDSVQIDKYTHFEILWPSNKMILENGLNNNSIVAKLVYGKFKMLFTGDIELIAEKDLIKKSNLKANILKVAHHGSNTSSCKDFISKVNPEIAIIGVGKNNKYGHPSYSVIQGFEKFNIKIYRTDMHGEIYVKVNKNGNYTTETHIK